MPLEARSAPRSIPLSLDLHLLQSSSFANFTAGRQLPSFSFSALSLSQEEGLSLSPQEEEGSTHHSLNTFTPCRLFPLSRSTPVEAIFICKYPLCHQSNVMCFENTRCDSNPIQCDMFSTVNLILVTHRGNLDIPNHLLLVFHL